MSKAKELGERFGGTWTYDNVSVWRCDDGERWVARCSSLFDSENEYAPQYWLYGDGSPIRVFWQGVR